MDALYIPPNTDIAGPVLTSNAVWVAGTVEGDIRTQEEIIITEVGSIRGAVRARSANMGGMIEGGISVSGQLVLEETARIRGDIAAAQLIVEEGAQFSGDSRMETPYSAPAEPESTTHSSTAKVTRTRPCGKDYLQSSDDSHEASTPEKSVP